MKIIESSKIKEKEYIEKLDNGMTVIVIPKPNLDKKYIIWGTHFGSIDNRFIMPKTGEEVFIPDGVAHFLEHKMFEQPDGTNSLDTLMALGLDANAYTTNDHTAYLFECTNNFYEGLDELMDYVQHPYFTDENVEKEKGIIGQEIKMYVDEPSWRMYMNAMDCMYKKNPIKILKKIRKMKIIFNFMMTLKCYNTFYNPSNMIMVVCGNFEPEEILKEIKKRLVKKEEQGEIKRIYPEKETEINMPYKEVEMEVSTPIFAIGYKDIEGAEDKKEIVRKHIAIEILMNMIIGKSSKAYKELYEAGVLLSTPDLDYEFSDEYAHILISGQSKNPAKIQEKIEKVVDKYKKEGLEEEHFNRIKKKIYGDYVVEYNSVGEIARMFLADKMKGINSFDYIEEYNTVTKDYTQEVLKNVFKKENMVMSVVKCKQEN